MDLNKLSTIFVIVLGAAAGPVIFNVIDPESSRKWKALAIIGGGLLGYSAASYLCQDCGANRLSFVPSSMPSNFLNQGIVQNPIQGDLF